MEESTTPQTTTIGDASAALAAATSSLATPETPASPVDSTPAAATVQPTDPQTPPAESVTPDASKEPPKWRWQDILANARETSAKEAEARVRQEVEQRYAALKPFEGMDPSELQGYRVMNAALAGDPQAIAIVKQNQQALAALRAIVAEQQQPQADPEPEPDLEAADGTLVYSATKQREWREWNNRQLTSQLSKEFEAKLRPFEQVAQTFQQRETQARAFTEVGQVLGEFRADPEFKAHEHDVKAELAKDQRLGDLADRDPKLALEIAFNRVYRAKVLPAKQQQTEAQVVANLQQRAVAATTNPAAASTATPKSTLGDARAALEHAYQVTGS